MLHNSLSEANWETEKQTQKSKMEATTGDRTPLVFIPDGVFLFLIFLYGSGVLSPKWIPREQLKPGDPVYPRMRGHYPYFHVEYYFVGVLCVVEMFFPVEYELILLPEEEEQVPWATGRRGLTSPAFCIIVCILLCFIYIRAVIRTIIREGFPWKRLKPIDLLCYSRGADIVFVGLIGLIRIASPEWKMIYRDLQQPGEPFYHWWRTGISVYGAPLILVILRFIHPPLAKQPKHGEDQVYTWRPSDIITYVFLLGLVIFNYIKNPLPKPGDYVDLWRPIDVVAYVLLLILILLFYCVKDRFSNEIQREQLKPGDHIYSWRPGRVIAHHGIYVGDQMVIHFIRGSGEETGLGFESDNISALSSTTSPYPWGNSCPICGDQSRDTGVISSCVDCFRSGGRLYVFKYGVSLLHYLLKARGGTCTPVCADRPEVVLDRSSVLLGNGFGSYNAFRNNCEDFAIYCKTSLLLYEFSDTGRSGQASSMVSARGAMIYVVVFGIANIWSFFVIYIIYILDRWCGDVGFRCDIARVAVGKLVESLADDGHLIGPEPPADATGKFEVILIFILGYAPGLVCLSTTWSIFLRFLELLWLVLLVAFAY